MTSPQEPVSSREVQTGGLSKPDAETLAGEVVTLRRDLWLLRTAYLPVLLRSANPATAERWQDTTRKLADALPREGESEVVPLDAGPVLELLQAGDPDGGLLLSPPSDCFDLVGDRLCWHVYPHSGQGAAERQEQVRFVLRWAGAGDERTEAPWLELQRVLPAVQEFFLALPPTSDKRMGGYVAVLPLLAELNPPFAAQALDRGRLLAGVEGDPTLTPAEGERQLSVLSSRFFAGCLCNSLALTLEALANNHFAEIAPLLGLPKVFAYAFWSDLMPKILLATLYCKATALRDLAQKVRSDDRLH